jgi:hypothetical protein
MSGYNVPLREIEAQISYTPKTMGKGPTIAKIFLPFPSFLLVGSKVHQLRDARLHLKSSDTRSYLTYGLSHLQFL